MTLHNNVSELDKANPDYDYFIETGTNDQGETLYRHHPVTEAIVLGCMTTGLGEITEKNWPEFYARFTFLDRVCGPFLMERADPDGEYEPHRLTPAEVRAHIGLRTNAFPAKTRAQWLKTFGLDLDRLARDAKRAPMEVEPFGGGV